MVKFPGDGKGLNQITNDSISAKVMQLGIPYNTSTDQLAAIAKSIEYANGLKPPILIIVTKVK
jgi:filamentous hemagglutinin